MGVFSREAVNEAEAPGKGEGSQRLQTRVRGWALTVDKQAKDFAPPVFRVVLLVGSSFSSASRVHSPPVWTLASVRSTCMSSLT